MDFTPHAMGNDRNITSTDDRVVLAPWNRHERVEFKDSKFATGGCMEWKESAHWSEGRWEKFERASERRQVVVE